LALREFVASIPPKNTLTGNDWNKKGQRDRAALWFTFPLFFLLL